MEEEEIDLKKAIDKDMGEDIEEEEEEDNVKIEAVNTTDLDEGLGEDVEDDEGEGELGMDAQAGLNILQG